LRQMVEQSEPSSNANITRRCTRTIFPLRFKIASELGRYALEIMN